MQEKQNIRKTCIQRRNEIDSFSHQRISRIICDSLVELPLWEKADSLFVYAAKGNEIDLKPLIENAFEERKRVFFPKVFGNEMVFYQVQDFSQLSIGKFDIFEPTDGLNRWEADDIYDRIIMLVPGVAFSYEGQRIGYGKGYYDRYLSKHSNFYTIGICYDEFLLNPWIADGSDYPMDFVITEKRKVQCNGNATGIM